MGENKKRSRRGKKLNPREMHYVVESLKPGVSRVEASRRAGLDRIPQGKGVDEYRTHLLRRALQVGDATADNIILELARIAFCDPRAMFNEDGTMRQINEFDDDMARAVAGFDIEKRTEGKGEDKEVYYVLKPRLWSKPQALQMLAQYRNLLKGEGEERNHDRLQEIVDAIREPSKGFKRDG